jgi:hypothetical protein
VLPAAPATGGVPAAPVAPTPVAPVVGIAAEPVPATPVDAAGAPIVTLESMNGSLVDAPPPTHPVIVIVCVDGFVDCVPGVGVWVAVDCAAAVAAAHAKINPVIIGNLICKLLLLIAIPIAAEVCKPPATSTPH